MKKSVFLLFFLCILLASCSKGVTEEELIGGKWIGTAGYEDGKVNGEPFCYPFHTGIEFKDEDSVFVHEANKEFTYSFVEFDDGQVIDFYNSDIRLYTYYIEKISENEIALKGVGENRKDHSCYLERE